ncbi:MAG: hypothetical protein LUF83_10845 [Alistipes sp.]|nr:hypothetical protein [Alistipes sp.]
MSQQILLLLIAVWSGGGGNGAVEIFADFARQIHERVFVAKRQLPRKEAGHQATAGYGRAREAKILGNEKQCTHPDGTAREMAPIHNQTTFGNVQQSTPTLIKRRKSLSDRQSILSEKGCRIRSVIFTVQVSFYVAKGHKDQTSGFRWQNYNILYQLCFRKCDKKFRKYDKGACLQGTWAKQAC